MATTWNGTSSNQLVTFDALKDAVSTGVFDSKVALASIPTGKEIVTKADAETYLYLDITGATWSGYTSNRCPPKSSFQVLNLCTIVVISKADLGDATGNTSYPDNTVYVRTSSGTESFTIEGTYKKCTRPSNDYPSTEYIYYYKNDVIQYFVNSSISFYPNTISCTTTDCISTDYTVQYDAFTCPCTGGTTTTISVQSTPSWYVETRIQTTTGANVASGRYVYAGKCYRVQDQTINVYVYKGGLLQFVGTVTESRVTEVTNC